jgi:uracil-DNA glycosylase
MQSTHQTKQTASLEQRVKHSTSTLTSERLSLSELMQLPGLPARELRLKAFQLTPASTTSVIILGQDPYHTAGKANGLAFGIASDWQGNRYNSSFGNIVLEASRTATDTITPEVFQQWATLEGWAKQGVLLTNTRLSVEEGQPMSHANIGWEEVVRDEVASRILKSNPILVAFGAEARKFFKKALKFWPVDSDKIVMLAYSHPCKYSATRGSKYARAFVGSNCFNEINKVLLSRGQEPIDWWKV